MLLLLGRIAALFVLFRLAKSFLALRSMLLVRARAGAASLLDETDVPPHLAALLSETDAWTALGFEHAAWVRDEAVYGLPPYEPRLRRVLHRPGSGLWLWLEVGETARPDQPFEAWLVSHDLAGDTTQTGDVADAAHIMRYPPGFRFQLLGEVAPEVLVDAHRAAAGTDLELSPALDAHLARMRQTHERIVEHGIEIGDLRRAADGWAEPRLRRLIGPAWRAPGEGARALAKRKSELSLAALPVELELDAWRRADARRTAGGSRGLSLLALALTGGLFALSMFFDLAVVDVAVITAVIALHEGGHWLAMRLRGYEDARVFFVPFLGGAAVGHKERASLNDELLVLLAGPLPGMALGLALLIASAFVQLPDVATRAAVMLIGLNWFNLLPLIPLDGGRVVHRLVARGRPTVEVALRSFGALGLIAIAIWWETWILGIFAVFVTIAIPSGKRVARAERAVLDAGVPDERIARRRAILVALRDAMPGMLASLRISSARDVEARIDAPRGSLISRVLWGAVYLTVVGLPIAAWASTPSEPPEDEGLWIACGDIDHTLSELNHPVDFTLVRPYGDHAPLAIPDALRAYDYAMDRVCAPPPWRAPVPDDDRRARDASFVRIVETAREAESSVPRLERGGGEQPTADELERWFEQRAAASEAALRARLEGADPLELDGRIARAWIAMHDRSTDEAAQEAARLELADALGWPSECTEEQPVFRVIVGDDGVSVPGGAMRLVELAPLLHWLCDAGATGAFVSVAQTER